MEITSDLRAIESLISKSNFADAERLCIELLKVHSKNMELVRTTADVYSLAGNLSKSIETRIELIGLGSQEPADY